MEQIFHTVMEHLLTTQGWFLSMVYTQWTNAKMKEFIHSKCKRIQW